MIPMFYALVTSTVTLSGGILALYSRLRLVEQRYLVAFSGGSMVAIALFDLIPEMQTHNAWALLLGFFSIYLLEKLVLIHACHEAECETHTTGWGALIGIAIESLIDGMAIAVGFRTEPALGFLIALAISAHELPRGIATTVVMQQAGFKSSRLWLALLIDAGFVPLGVLLSGWIPTSAIEPLLGFTAGIFLYVGASDLLPEAHQRFNRSVVLATLTGAALIPSLGAVLSL